MKAEMLSFGMLSIDKMRLFFSEWPKRSCPAGLVREGWRLEREREERGGDVKDFLLQLGKLLRPPAVAGVRRA